MHSRLDNLKIVASFILLMLFAIFLVPIGYLMDRRERKSAGEIVEPATVGFVNGIIELYYWTKKKGR